MKLASSALILAFAIVPALAFADHVPLPEPKSVRDADLHVEVLRVQVTHQGDSTVAKSEKICDTTAKAPVWDFTTPEYRAGFTVIEGGKTQPCQIALNGDNVSLTVEGGLELVNWATHNTRTEKRAWASVSIQGQDPAKKYAGASSAASTPVLDLSSLVLELNPPSGVADEGQDYQYLVVSAELIDAQK